MQSSEEMELKELMGWTKGGNYSGKLFDMAPEQSYEACEGGNPKWLN